MITVYYSLEIERSQSQVFAFLTDPSKVTLWQRSVLTSKGTEGMPAGSIIEFDTQFLGRRSIMRIEMLENDGRTMTRARSLRGPVKFETTYDVEKLTDRQTRVTVKVKIDAGTIYKLAEPALQSVSRTILETDLKMLKAVMESS